MKRDMDLIRQILLVVEASPDAIFPVALDLAGYDQETLVYHTVLLDEAGLIVAQDVGDDMIEPVRLTWQGHEFLEAAKDETRWKKITAAMARCGGFVVSVASTELIKDLAGQAATLLGMP